MQETRNQEDDATPPAKQRRLEKRFEQGVKSKSATLRISSTFARWSTFLREQPCLTSCG